MSRSLQNIFFNLEFFLPVLILGLIGMGMVAKTADLGGKLVYKYGVGVGK